MLDIKARWFQESWEELIKTSYTECDYIFFNGTISMVLDFVPLKKGDLKVDKSNKTSDAEAERLRENFLRVHITQYTLIGFPEYKQEAALKKKN